MTSHEVATMVLFSFLPMRPDMPLPPGSWSPTSTATIFYSSLIVLAVCTSRETYQTGGGESILIESSTNTCSDFQRAVLQPLPPFALQEADSSSFSRVGANNDMHTTWVPPISNLSVVDRDSK
ncbi:uncharacterized protein APUU_80297A [Aspergillus puulaauensis]|uniref:Uncharacterized protein n=1 Tax=Aspergillus puulaauensis TaxID=1220207 RepID=A0A7R8AS24_9EURO|nr:uncharacterized protein APUU_80297A [Aspergillus puulaauensis]BCS29994.1 hypothetical protein APUU_80297A [Aspergillus puulaauensis]